MAIHKPANYDLRIEEADECACTFRIEQDSSEEFSYFHLVPPVYPSRYVTLTMQPSSMNQAHFIFSGNVSPFEESFAKAQYGLKKTAAGSGTGRAEYFQVKQDVDISDNETHKSLVTAICDELLASSPVYVRICASNADDDETLPALLHFIEKMGLRATVHIED